MFLAPQISISFAQQKLIYVGPTFLICMMILVYICYGTNPNQPITTSNDDRRQKLTNHTRRKMSDATLFYIAIQITASQLFKDYSLITNCFLHFDLVEQELTYASNFAVRAFT